MVMHGQEIRRRMFQRGFEGMRVRNTHAHFIEIGQPSLVIGAPILQAIQQVGVFGRQIRRQDALPGIREIMGRNRVAIGPARVGAQLERIHKPIVRHRPRFGYCRDRFQRCRVVIRQSFEQRAEHPMFGHARNQMGIELLHFSAIAHLQHIGSGPAARGTSHKCGKKTNNGK